MAAVMCNIRRCTWNWEPVGEGFRFVANQPMRLLRNCMKAQQATMKNEICNVEMRTQYNNTKWENPLA